MLKLPSLDLVFSSNRGELETLGTTYPSESVSIGGSTSQSGSKNSASKSGAPGNMCVNVDSIHRILNYTAARGHNLRCIWSV